VSIRRRNPHAGLERALRAGRARPSDELVRELAARIPARPGLGLRLRFAPRFAVVGATTLALAVALGVAGALGYASSSFKSFGENVNHVVSSPTTFSGTFTGTTTTSKDGNDDGKGDWGWGGCGKRGDDKDEHGDDNKPYKWEYGGCVPICHDGHIIFVPFKLYYWLLQHGDKPAWYCEKKDDEKKDDNKNR
jgi:hypothetical protein